ncbi:hypothetical protein Nmel_011393 [Mimus melanotis]
MSYLRAGADPNPSPNSFPVLCLAGACSPMAAAVLEGERCNNKTLKIQEK